MKLPIALLALVVAGASATAFAQTSQDEPQITAGSVLRLTRAGTCVRPARVSVSARPPAGVELDLVRVAIDGVLATRMTNVANPASITVHIPGGSSRLRVTVRSAGGQEVHADRRYRACAPRPPAPPASHSPVSQGGGED
jgi:predicted ribosomally synthesized peptide with SipW-like signal peptide